MKKVIKPLTPHIIRITFAIVISLFTYTTVFSQCSSATAVTAIDVVANENGTCDFTINLNYTNSSGSGNSSIIVDIFLSDGSYLVRNECISNISGSGFAIYGPFRNVDCQEVLSVDWIGKTNPTCGGSSCDSGTFTATGPIVLPIELESFEVEPRVDEILLTWITTTESNSDYFSIEHSIDGINFYEIETIQAHGNSIEKHYYAFSHQDGSKAANYYRLVQYDLDGSIGFISEIKKGNFITEVNNILVYPTVFENQIQLEFDERIERDRNIEVVSSNGVMMKQAIFAKDSYNQTLHLDDLVAGTYFIVIYDEIHRDVKRVIKIRD